MTDLLTRPVLRVPAADDGPRRSLLLGAVIVGAWVAVLGLVACVLVAVTAWFAVESGSFSGAVRVGALAWLVLAGAGLQLDGVSVTIVPLGFVLVSAVLLHRGGRWVGQRSDVSRWWEIAVGTTVTSITYASALVIAAAVTETPAAQVSLTRAAVAGAAVAALATGSGLLRSTMLDYETVERLPEEIRAALVGGLAGTMVMIVAGALLFTGALVMHFSEAVTLTEGLGAGLVGGIVITLIAASLVPNAILCAGAFAAGPGFSIGQDTMVAPGTVDLGAMPAFPLLAALPRTADSWWVDLLVLAPVLAGGVAGVVAVRRYPVFGVDRAALRGGFAGATGGVGFGLLACAAMGAVGPGRMQQVGPDGPAVLLVVTAAGLVGGAIAAAAHRWVQAVRVRRSTRRRRGLSNRMRKHWRRRLSPRVRRWRARVQRLRARRPRLRRRARKGH
jgi:hypothetical protein